MNFPAAKGRNRREMAQCSSSGQSEANRIVYRRSPERNKRDIAPSSKSIWKSISSSWPRYQVANNGPGPMHIIPKGEHHAREPSAHLFQRVVFVVIVVAIMLSPNAAGSLVINCILLARLVHGIVAEWQIHRAEMLEGRYSCAFSSISRVVASRLGKVYACKGDGRFFDIGGVYVMISISKFHVAIGKSAGKLTLMQVKFREI